VVIAGLPYALGVTTVIFGKHIDKYAVDKAKGIHTLPVVIGEKAGRITVVAMMLLQYLAVGYLVLRWFIDPVSLVFTPVMLIVLLALKRLASILPMFGRAKPDEKPEGYPDVWPNYFVAAAFVHNRTFGLLFMLGLILNAVIVQFI
jgi:1,4-dihydroxy-2-naphthoate octaprenyltransferase